MEKPSKELLHHECEDDYMDIETPFERQWSAVRGHLRAMVDAGISFERAVGIQLRLARVPVSKR